MQINDSIYMLEWKLMRERSVLKGFDAKNKSIHEIVSGNFQIVFETVRADKKIK